MKKAPGGMGGFCWKAIPRCYRVGVLYIRGQNKEGGVDIILNTKSDDLRRKPKTQPIDLFPVAEVAEVLRKSFLRYLRKPFVQLIAVFGADHHQSAPKHGGRSGDCICQRYSLYF